MFLASTGLLELGSAMTSLIGIIFGSVLICSPIMIWYWAKKIYQELYNRAELENEAINRMKEMETNLTTLTQEIETLVKVTAQIAINQETLIAYMAQLQPGTHVEGVNDVIDVNSIAREVPTGDGISTTWYTCE